MIATLSNGQAAIDHLRETVLAPKTSARTTVVQKSVEPGANHFCQISDKSLDDDALIDKAKHASNGADFVSLWNGSAAGHGGDESAADLALCNHLAFWFGKDAPRMDRSFRRSGLMRDKWDEQRGEETYGQRTIRVAIEGCGNTYDPKHRKVDEQIASVLQLQSQGCQNSDNLNGENEQLILSPSEPLQTARKFDQLFHHDGDRSKLLTFGDTTYRSNGFHHVEHRRAEIRAALYPWLDTAKKWKTQGDGMVLVPFGPNTHSVNNVVDALMAETFFKHAPPVWVDGDGPDPKQLIVAKNGIVHLTPDGEPVVIGPPTPRLFTLNSLDFPYDPDAPDPLGWLKFLDIWKQAPASILTLQEWFGYCLVGDTQFHKALMLIGPKRSGKGTICRMLIRLLGASNVAGSTLSGLARPFGLWGLIGKLLAIIGDARLSGRADIALIVERILSLTGEDAIEIDRKMLEPITMRLIARLILVSNELPKLSDASGALASRFIILQLNESFYGKEDTKLEEKLATEMPGILRWSIEGWKRLMRQGCFTIPQSSVDAMEEMEDLASPAKAFIRDCCDMSPGGRIIPDDLYEAWCYWCEQEGRAPGTKAVFGRDLHAAAPAVHCSNRHVEDRRQRQYDGIRLKLSICEAVAVWRSSKEMKHKHSEREGAVRDGTRS